MLPIISLHNGTLCHIEDSDIPPMPKSLMFIYMKLEQKIGLDRIGYLTTSELFSEYSFKDDHKECMQIINALAEYKAISYKLKYGKKYFITLLPKNNANTAKGIRLYNYGSKNELEEILNKLDLKTVI